MLKLLFGYIKNIFKPKGSKKLLIPSTNLKSFNKEISPNDTMFLGDNQFYFYWGMWSLNCVQKVLAKLKKQKINNILDLPCGHGRSMRFFKAAFPSANLTACELDKDGVDFCVKTFGAKGVYSSTNPSEISLNNKYDLIWCGSLFTHLDQHKWREFLTFFSDHLEQDGVLIFTTHGNNIIRHLRSGKVDLGLGKTALKELLKQHDSAGIAYCDYPEQNGYGVSLSQNEWVLNLIKEFPKLSLIEEKPSKWGGPFYYQNVYTVVRN
ncbi:MAG: hypothetical protein COA67_00675 [Lutibacter sp.]|nr:MAG: hypothetical protein COA67_00675 [Lutibacter sp.]